MLKFKYGTWKRFSKSLFKFFQGGFATAMVMGTPDDTYKCGISGNLIFRNF